MKATPIDFLEALYANAERWVDDEDTDVDRRSV